MRNRWRLLFGIAILAAIGGAGWLVFDFYFAVPSSLVGEWENDNTIYGAKPGEVRLTVFRDGEVAVTFDRKRHNWNVDELHCRVRGDRVEIASEGMVTKGRIEVGADRFRIWDTDNKLPQQDELVFRRVAQP